MKRLLPLALLALSVLTACGAGASGDDRSVSGDDRSVSGTLRMTGGPPGVSQPGVEGQVSFTSNGTTKTFDAAADGTFTGSVPEGTYTVTGTSPQYVVGQSVCRADAPVEVTQADVTGVVVACSRK